MINPCIRARLMSSWRFGLGPTGSGQDGMPMVPQIEIRALTLIRSSTRSNCWPPTLSKKQSTPSGQAESSDSHRQNLKRAEEGQRGAGDVGLVGWRVTNNKK